MIELITPILPYLALAVIVPVTAKIALNSGWYQSKSMKKKQRLDDEYIDELETRMRFYKNKANAMEKGPKLDEGDMDDISKVLPQLVGQFKDFAPKWLQPFLGNPQIQEALIQKVKEDPEKYVDMIGKLVKKSTGKKDEATVDTLSV